MINKYLEEDKAIKILQNEEKLVGKYFKIDIEYEYTHYKETHYIKVLSAINRSSYQVWTMDFVLPISAKFKHRLQMNSKDKFDFHFEDDDIIWFEDHSMHDFEAKNCIEITKEEYENAYTKLMSDLLAMSNEAYLLSSIFGGDYETEIKELSLQQREEKDEKV